MRLLIFLVALSVPSTAWGGRIYIEAASATYWSATDELEVRVWFTPAVTVPGAWVAIGGRAIDFDFWDSSAEPRNWFLVENDWAIRSDTFLVRSIVELYDPITRARSQVKTITGSFQIAFNDDHFTARIPLTATGLADPLIRLNVMIYQYLRYLLVDRPPRRLHSRAIDRSARMERRRADCLVYSPASTPATGPP